MLVRLQDLVCKKFQLRCFYLLLLVKKKYYKFNFDNIKRIRCIFKDISCLLLQINSTREPQAMSDSSGNS